MDLVDFTFLSVIVLVRNVVLLGGRFWLVKLFFDKEVLWSIRILRLDVEVSLFKAVILSWPGLLLWVLLLISWVFQALRFVTHSAHVIPRTRILSMLLPKRTRILMRLPLVPLMLSVAILIRSLITMASMFKIGIDTISFRSSPIESIASTFSVWMAIVSVLWDIIPIFVVVLHFVTLLVIIVVVVRVVLWPPWTWAHSPLIKVARVLASLVISLALPFIVGVIEHAWGRSLLRVSFWSIFTAIGTPSLFFPPLVEVLLLSVNDVELLDLANWVDLHFTDVRVFWLKICLGWDRVCLQGLLRHTVTDPVDFSLVDLLDLL